MGSFVVTVTGGEPREVAASTWLAALGDVLATTGGLDSLDRLACERMPNGTVIARDVKRGTGYVVLAADEAPTPAKPKPETPGFTVGDLPREVFSENLRHDLRTPLGAILGYAEILLEETAELGQPSLGRDLRRIHASAEQLLELLDACLDAAKVAGGEAPMHPEKLALRPLLDELASHAAPRQPIAIACPRDLVAFTDAFHLRSALTRLLALASEAAVGPIQLAVTGGVREPASLRLVFPAPPLPAADAAGMFEVFARTEGEASRAALTVRLATSRELLRRGGGDILALPHDGQRRGFEVRLAQALGDETAVGAPSRQARRPTGR